MEVGQPGQEGDRIQKQLGRWRYVQGEGGVESDWVLAWVTGGEGDGSFSDMMTSVRGGGWALGKVVS